MIDNEEEQTNKSRKVDYNLKHILSYVYWRLKDKGFSYKDINRIVSLYHDLMFTDLTMGKSVNLLKGIGKISIKKYKTEVYFNDDGKLVNTSPINYKATYDLWKANPKLYKKQYVRYLNEHTDGYLFSMRYSSNIRAFKNSKIYTFHKNNYLKKGLSKNITNNKVDATLGKKY